MDCPKCGAPQPESVRFCTKCGAKLESLTETSENRAPEPEAQITPVVPVVPVVPQPTPPQQSSIQPQQPIQPQYGQPAAPQPQPQVPYGQPNYGQQGGQQPTPAQQPYVPAQQPYVPTQQPYVSAQPPAPIQSAPFQQPYVPAQQQQPYANYQAQVGQPGYPGQPSYLGQPKKKSKGPLIGIISVSAAVLIVAVVLLFTFVIMPDPDNKSTDDPAVVTLPPSPTPLTDPVDPTPTPAPNTDDYVPELVEEYHSSAYGLTITIGERWKRDDTSGRDLYLNSTENDSFVMFYEETEQYTDLMVNDIDAFLEEFKKGFGADDVELIKQGKVKLGSQTWHELEFIVSLDGGKIHIHMYFIDSSKGTVVAVLAQTEKSQGSIKSEKDKADMLAMLGTVTFDTDKPFD